MGKITRKKLIVDEQRIKGVGCRATQNKTRKFQ